MPDKKRFSLKKIAKKLGIDFDSSVVSELGYNKDKVPTQKKEEYKPVAEDSAKIKPIKINPDNVKDSCEFVKVAVEKLDKNSENYLKLLKAIEEAKKNRV
ncbi:MAG TPA: hypothetical protein PLZ05_00095 [Alphaproteobacteria bacterium]|nr:hypothetical protein [Alphaproteobacteria bacterium]